VSTAITQDASKAFAVPRQYSGIVEVDLIARGS
jgi:hypothetical protein